MFDVFISYARVEREKVWPIRQALSRLGVTSFFDLEDMDGGTSFPDAIDRSLRASRAVLACWSPLYFERDWCRIECRDGLLRQRLVPVCIEAFDAGAVPADLRLLNYFDLSAWDGSETPEWRRTVRALRRLIDRPLARPVGAPSSSLETPPAWSGDPTVAVAPSAESQALETASAPQIAPTIAHAPPPPIAMPEAPAPLLQVSPAPAIDAGLLPKLPEAGELRRPRLNFETEPPSAPPTDEAGPKQGGED